MLLSKKIGSMVNIIIKQKKKSSPEHQEVARLELASKDVYSALDIAYRLTQNLDFSWCNSKHLTVHDRAKQGCRSTSVGDVLSIDGREYLVCVSGFSEIKKTRKGATSE